MAPDGGIYQWRSNFPRFGRGNFLHLLVKRPRIRASFTRACESLAF
jgi:hypothetical protein